MRTAIALFVILISGVAYAGNADDMCTLMTVEQHGLRCKVRHYDDGSLPTLLIKTYITADADETKKARARLATNQVIEAHLRERGGSIEMRVQRKDGAWLERSCNRIKGTNRANCEEWHPAKEDGAVL